MNEQTVDLQDPEVVARNAYRRGWTQDETIPKVGDAICEAHGCDGFLCTRSHARAAQIVARVWAEEASSDA